MVFSRPGFVLLDLLSAMKRLVWLMEISINKDKMTLGINTRKATNRTNVRK